MPSVRIELADGQHFESRSVFATALSLADLERYRSRRGLGLDLELRFEAGSLNGRPFPAGRTALHLTPHESLNVFALVEGGWLPPPFTNPAALLVDQNVVISFERILSGRVSSHLEDFAWWMELLNDSETILNPLPYALEGTRQRPPTLEEVAEALTHGAEQIRSVLPKVTVTHFGEPQYRSVFELIRQASARSARDAAFLVDVAPLLSRPVALGQELDAESEVLARAMQHGVPPRAFCVIASLSCIYRGRHAKPIGMKVIRPSLSFSLASGYAAASDIRLLELVLKASTLTSEPRFSLCTQDTGLASFWSALRPALVPTATSTYSLQFELAPELFPRLSDTSVQALHDRLQSAARECLSRGIADVW